VFEREEVYTPETGFQLSGGIVKVVLLLLSSLLLCLECHNTWL
jgi:hypothetical protein